MRSTSLRSARPLTLTSAFTLLIAMGVPFAGAAQPEPAHAPMGHASGVISVTGEGEVAVAPDRAVVSFGVVAGDADAGEAQETANRTIAAAVEAVEALGVDGLVLQTGQLYLNARYDNRRNRESDEAPRIVGYTATVTLSARVDDLSRVADVIDAALGAGVNRLDGLRFTLRDDAEQQRRALELAIADARRKADVAVRAMGAREIGFVELIESGAQAAHSSNSTALYRIESGGAWDGGSGSSVQAGEVVVKAGVTLRFRAQDQRQMLHEREEHARPELRESAERAIEEMRRAREIAIDARNEAVERAERAMAEARERAEREVMEVREQIERQRDQMREVLEGQQHQMEAMRDEIRRLRDEAI